MAVEYDNWEKNIMKEALSSNILGDKVQLNEEESNVPEVDELSNEYLSQFLEPHDEAEITLSEMDRAIDNIASWKKKRVDSINRLHRELKQGLGTSKGREEEEEDHYDPVETGLRMKLERIREKERLSHSLVSLSEVPKLLGRSITKDESNLIEESIRKDPDDTPWHNIDAEVMALELKELELEAQSTNQEANEEEEDQEQRDLQMKLEEYANELDQIMNQYDTSVSI